MKWIFITDLLKLIKYQTSWQSVMWEPSYFIYVVIKCQLDATEVFTADLIACSTCFGHHYAHHQELTSIIQWLLPVVIRAVVFQVAGLVWSWGLCVWFAGCCFTLQRRFLLQILLLAQHVSGITMRIIRSSRVLYSGCCVWYFVL